MDEHMDISEWLPDEDKKKLFAALISMSTGIENVTVLDIMKQLVAICWPATTKLA